MIRDDKLHNALYALHAIFVRGRLMAYESRSETEIAELLDDAEILPSMLASKEDQTDQFRAHIAEMAKRHPWCLHVLQRIDEGATEKWW